MSHGGKRRKAHHGEEHENHERWLISYADMVTLLMCLFIVLYAISQVDAAKFNQFKVGLSAGFGAPLAAVSGGTGPLDESGVSPAPMDIMTSVTPPDAAGAVSPAIKNALEQADKTERENARSAKARELTRLDELKKRLEAALVGAGLAKQVRLDIDPTRGLVVSIVTDEVIFVAERADLQPTGRAVLTAIAPVLEEVENPIVVEGHTSTEKVKPRYFDDDWDLSASRAAKVASYLDRDLGIPRKRITSTGMADQHPIDFSGTPEGQKRNRRVEVVLLSSILAGS